jgi:hypothetical protein
LNRRTLVTLTVVGVLMLGLPVLATTINRAIQPQRHAEAARCLEPAAGSELTNGCDTAINAAVCQRGETADRNDDPCRMQRLEPGEAFTNHGDAPRGGASYTLACEAPFVPKWGPSLSNAAVQRKTCRRPDAPASP